MLHVGTLVAHGAYEHGGIWAWVHEVGSIRDTNSYPCVQWVEQHGFKLVWKDIRDWVVNQINQTNVVFINVFPCFAHILFQPLDLINNDLLSKLFVLDDSQSYLNVGNNLPLRNHQVLEQKWLQGLTIMATTLHDLGKPNHTCVPCWMPKPLTPRNECIGCFAPTRNLTTILNGPYAIWEK